MEPNIRYSANVLKVLRLLADRPRQGLSGAEISRATGVGPGTLYPLLARLERAGLLDSEWEQIDPKEAGRPRRRYYSLTPTGLSRTLEELKQFQIALGVPVWTS